MVDIRAHESYDDPNTRLMRGYDEKGHPLCPFGYVLQANDYDYGCRRAKWRCAKQCLQKSERPTPQCGYLKAQHKHGCTVTVGRTPSDGSVRLACEIPCGSPTWKKRYGRRNSAESRNSILERLESFSSPSQACF